MNEPKVWDLDYINFLLATPCVVSTTEAERIQPEEPRRAAHDTFTPLIHQLEPDTTPLWFEAEALIDRTRGLLVIDDSTLDKRYSYDIVMIHRHWSGKHRLADVVGILLFKRQGAELTGVSRRKCLADRAVQGPLVPLDRDDVVGSLLTDRLNGLGLAVQGVQGDYTALQRQPFEQCRDRPNLVGLTQLGR